MRIDGKKRRRRTCQQRERHVRSGVKWSREGGGITEEEEENLNEHPHFMLRGDNTGRQTLLCSVVFEDCSAAALMKNGIKGLKSGQRGILIGILISPQTI